MPSPVRISFGKLILLSIVIYLSLVLATYLYLEASSLKVLTNSAYRADLADFHDLGDSYLLILQPQGYVRLEYVFGERIYKGWATLPYVEWLTIYQEPGQLNVSIYVIDVAPNLIASYIFRPGNRVSIIPPSHGLINSNYGAEKIRIIYRNVGDVPVELVIRDVEMKVYPDTAYSFYSICRLLIGDLFGIVGLNLGLMVLLGISISLLPIIIIITILYLLYLRIHRVG